MKPDLLHLLLAAAAIAPVQAAAAPSDRHPGIYQFSPISPSVCADRERQRQFLPRRERLQRLGDLPPAYVIRLSDSKPATGDQRVRAFAAPGYDPCGMIVRVK